ncbi:hypothetical protein IDH44_07440 [Paenibacillus sp. IB182496]|uniref:Alpha-galactosidase n=1 Tax=Paenibacillus sabuli TaxID=2772509 RepID=A0A927BT36_9BACL|nr:hypothetical protein [Paenibacillus sabuli]MBD2845019.1 hypothetical protein [Paenibacillus sabuli]
MREQLMQYEDCYVRLDGGGAVTIGNAKLERRYRVADGRLLTVGLRDKHAGGGEWLAETPSEAIALPWLGSAAETAAVSARVDDEAGLTRPRLLVAIDLAYPEQQTLVRWESRICPGSPWIGQECQVRRLEREEQPAGRLVWTSEALAEDGGAQGAGQEEERLDNEEHAKAREREDRIDALALRALHCRYRTVALRDVTDRNNNLVGGETGLLYPNERRAHRGNVLVLERTLEPGGLLVIKEGPTALAHLQDTGADFRFAGLLLTVCGSGLSDAAGFAEEEGDAFIRAYGTVVGVCDGSRYGALAVLRDYEARKRVYRAERDYTLMSNTWGDRSRDGRVNEAFMTGELAQAGRLGLTHVQIDDGWQKGTTANSVVAGGVWSDGYYAADPQFWGAHPERLPGGLAPLAARAAEAGVKLGLWFSPDGTDDYAAWTRDAETLLRLHRDYAVEHFKLDGIRIGSKLAETRLHRMMRRVARESDGAVCFNLDATSGVRLGYYRHMEHGCLFLENRYTDSGSYYPHWTLRNLWQLAPYVPTRRLQAELLNVQRNEARYGDDPLAPAACGLLYGFMVTIMANPLVWMETTGLSAEEAERLAAAVRLVRPHHTAMLDGHVLPIGEEPSGVSWTGLQSITGPDEGYLLVFRELTDRAEGRLRLWQTDGAPLALRCVARLEARERLVDGAGEPPLRAEADSDGRYAFVLPGPLTCALYRYGTEAQELLT